MKNEQKIANDLVELELYTEYKILDISFVKKYIKDQKIPVSFFCNKCKKERVFNATFEPINLFKENLSIYLNCPLLHLEKKAYDEISDQSYDWDSYSLYEFIDENTSVGKVFNIEEYSLIFNWLICNFCHEINCIIFSLNFEKNTESESFLKLIKIGSTIEIIKTNNIPNELLDNELYLKALKSNSLGMHIGAFLYLRKIIETEISSILLQLEIKFENKDAFNRKLQKLIEADFLENKDIFKPLYSYLSKGVHELNEEECKKAFKLVKDILEFLYVEIKSRKIKFEKRELIKKDLDRLINLKDK